MRVICHSGMLRGVTDCEYDKSFVRARSLFLLRLVRTTINKSSDGVVRQIFLRFISIALRVSPRGKDRCLYHLLNNDRRK